MQNVKKRGILSLLLTMFMISGIAAGLFALSKKAYAAEDYHTWRQHDERWGSVSMGSSTIARSGCLITSLSIMAMHSDSLDDSALKNMKINSVDEFNPGVLANAYTERKGFSYGGGIASWGTLGQIIPSITFLRDSYLKGTTKSEIAAEIKAMMESGQHIIVNANGHHWVYIEGVVGDEVYMIDPADDSVLLFDYYGVNIGMEYWALTCKNPPSDFTPPLTVDIPAEYYYSGEGELAVYGGFDDGAEQVAALRNGNIVMITNLQNGFGAIADSKNGILGWVEFSALTVTGDEHMLKTGDINNDDAVDMYDLALLNEYLRCRSILPDGISTLRKCEAAAADINSDGEVNNADVIEYLEIICE